VTILDKFRYLP